MARGRINLSIIIQVVFLLTIMMLSTISISISMVSASPGDNELDLTKVRISTAGQFLELKNTGLNAMDMSRVQIAYYNNYDLSKATSSKLISLNGQLAPNEYYMVNDSAVTLCYQTTVASASLGFSTTSGMLQIIYLEQSEVGGQFSSRVLDSFAWSKSAVANNNNVVQLPFSNPNSFLQDNEGAWVETWPSASNPCQYETGVGAVDEQDESVDYVFLGSTLPPVRRVATTTTSSNNKINRNIGKMAPVINEILPNPASPQTDADDEFIELYNPNDSNFDLTGFKLAFGSKNPKKYTFPEGTVLSPKQFKAFMSGETSISLSNTEAQVWLLDPNDKVITQSEPYTKAKDGQSWALDSGRWIWTSVPTPNEINVLSSTGSNAKTKQVATVLGISSTKGGTGEAGSDSAPHKLADKMPVNSVVLAVVGLTAIGYALYEYRYDISNKIYELRRYLKNRREIRRQV
jgi:hypothetical protein